MPAYNGGRFAPPAPVATVAVRRPDGTQSVPAVAMLIDSGADVTLLDGPGLVWDQSAQ